MITSGNVHDMQVAKACIAAMPPSAELVSDKPCPELRRRGLQQRPARLARLARHYRRHPVQAEPQGQLDCDHAIYKQRNAIAATVIWWLK
jgi:hypothetical protein